MKSYTENFGISISWNRSHVSTISTPRLPTSREKSTLTGRNSSFLLRTLVLIRNISGSEFKTPAIWKQATTLAAHSAYTPFLILCFNPNSLVIQRQRCQPRHRTDSLNRKTSSSETAYLRLNPMWISDILGKDFRNFPLSFKKKYSGRLDLVTGLPPWRQDTQNVKQFYVYTDTHSTRHSVTSSVNASLWNNRKYPNKYKDESIWSLAEQTECQLRLLFEGNASVVGILTSCAVVTNRCLNVPQPLAVRGGESHKPDEFSSHRQLNTPKSNAVPCTCSVLT